MSEREAAAEAARANGREKATFEVIGSTLTRNGRTLNPGTRLRIARADAEILVTAGRIKPAKGKARPDAETVDDGPVAADEPEAAASEHGDGEAGEPE